LFPCFFISYKIIKASVFENVSKFGKSSIAKDNEIIYLRAALLPAPMPFLITCKAASSISLSFPEIPFAPTALALR
jgi:hypothetical protein